MGENLPQQSNPNKIGQTIFVFVSALIAQCIISFEVKLSAVDVLIGYYPNIYPEWPLIMVVVTAAAVAALFVRLLHRALFRSCHFQIRPLTVVLVGVLAEAGLEYGGMAIATSPSLGMGDSILLPVLLSIIVWPIVVTTAFLVSGERHTDESPVAVTSSRWVDTVVYVCVGLVVVFCVIFFHSLTVAINQRAAEQQEIGERYRKGIEELPFGSSEEDFIKASLVRGYGEIVRIDSDYLRNAVPGIARTIKNDGASASELTKIDLFLILADIRAFKMIQEDCGGEPVYIGHGEFVRLFVGDKLVYKINSERAVFAPDFLSIEQNQVSICGKPHPLQTFSGVLLEPREPSVTSTQSTYLGIFGGPHFRDRWYDVDALLKDNPDLRAQYQNALR